MFAVTLKLSSTVRSFPKLPVGLRTATKRSPSDSSAYASDHEGIDGMATANAAPRHCIDTFE